MSQRDSDAPAMAGEGLYEILSVQQIRGEPKRRWFFSDEMDLIVWLDEDERPASFQLSYDRQRYERAIRWKPAQGFTHFEVEGGRLATGPATALLLPAGPFEAAKVRSRFLALSHGIPWVITEFVADRLRAHAEHRSKATIVTALATVALVAIPVLILACLRLSGGRAREDHD